MKLPLLGAGLLVILSLIASAHAEPVPQPVEWKVAAHTGGGGRVLFAKDPVLFELGRDPGYLPEFAGKVQATEKGKVAHALLQSGWAYCAYTSATEQTVLVEGRGFHSLFVNGDRFAGDFYRHGWLRIPIPLREGLNKILVRAIRGEFTIRFLPAEGPCSLSPKDPTLPDIRGTSDLPNTGPGAVIVLNHTGERMTNAFLTAGDNEVFRQVTVPVPAILPHGMVKVRFDLTSVGRLPQDEFLDEKGRYRLPVVLRRGTFQQTASYPLVIRKRSDAFRETRLSVIDGSVQYHAVRPPVNWTGKNLPFGRGYPLYLSLHGASVEAYRQARAYRPKRDAFVVAPTNRRPFGFDWQDWGRLDALEALNLTMKRYRIDPDRVYLTGHSMGGHGTWYLGCLYPSRFAAIAPSAGWRTFFGYGGGMPRTFGEPRLEAFTHTHTENDIIEYFENLAGTPVYVLHGEKDDNVPLSEAEAALTHLAGFHKDYESHIQPGAGHWWGDECVDWNPLFEFCRRHIRIRKPLKFTFRTFNPAVTSTHAWVTVVSQITPARMSSVSVDADPRKGEIRIETGNVEELQLDLKGVVPETQPKVVLDGQEFTFSSILGDAMLYRDGEGTWHANHKWPSETRRKSIRLGGPFKLAFNQRMVWVYGTHGTPEENAATLAKVRYDAEVWWYRANGDVRVMPDSEYDPERYHHRNVILYGNEETNSAFAKLLPDCPVRITRKGVTAGGETFDGDYGLYFVYPISATNLAGVVGATTASVMRMNQQARYFISGTAVPDWVVWSPDILQVGMEGVAAAGYFDNFWK